MRLLRQVVGSGVPWAALHVAVVLANLPWIAYQLRHRVEAQSYKQLTLTLSAVHEIRRAERAGEFTVLIAGTSVSQSLHPERVAPRGTCAVACLWGGNVFWTTSFARTLIDYAPADVVVVPLTWLGFSSSPGWPEGEIPAETAWVAHPGEEEGKNGIGVGTTLGLLRQLDLLVQEHVPNAFRSRPPPAAGEFDAGEGHRQFVHRHALQVGTPSAPSLQRLEALRAYAATRGVRVLYYLSPQDPWFYESDEVYNRQFETFRTALGPHLDLDLGRALPHERFRGDVEHFDQTGDEFVARKLREAILDANRAPLATRPNVPRLTWRIRAAGEDVVRQVQQIRLEVVATLTGGAATRDTFAGNVRRFLAEIRLQASQYPRYIRVILGREDRPKSQPDAQTDSPEP